APPRSPLFPYTTLFRSLGRFEIEALDELAGVLGAKVAVHAAVLPFDGERAIVADLVERADDGFPVDAAVARRAEIPAAARVAGRSEEHTSELQSRGHLV